MAVDPTMSVKRIVASARSASASSQRARFTDLRHEAPDLVGDLVSGFEGKVSDAGHLDEPRIRHARGDVTGDLQRHDRVQLAVQDERWNAHGRKHVPDVDFLVHPTERLERAGARTEANQFEKRVGIFVVEGPERRHRLQCLPAWTEEAQVPLDLALVFLLGSAPGVIRRPHCARICAANDERPGSLRIRRREEDAHCRPLGQAVEGGATRTDCVHDRPHVVHPRLERRRSADAVRHPGSALVEADQPAETRELVKEGRETRHLPVQARGG